MDVFVVLPPSTETFAMELRGERMARVRTHALLPKSYVSWFVVEQIVKEQSNDADTPK